MNMLLRLFVVLVLGGIGGVAGTYIWVYGKFDEPKRVPVAQPKPRVRTPEELKAQEIARTTFQPEELPENAIIATNGMKTYGPEHGLAGQLITEAFLMVCREDFQLPTRSDYLHERVDTENALQIYPDMTLNAQNATYNPDKFSIRLGKEFGKKKSVQIVDGKVDGVLKIDLAIREHQKLVDEDFPRLLQQIGFKKAEKTTFKQDVSDLLLTTPPLDIIQIFVNLRRLHQALLAEPHSAELLATLSEHYSVIGSLTEPHWGPKHKSFKARAILYAHRGLKSHPDDGRLLWSLALAYGLSGMEYLSKPAIEKAQALPDAAKPPEWAPALIAFVEWNEPETQRLANENLPFARYLRMLAIEMCGTDSQSIAAVADVVQDHPECYRGSMILAHTGPLGLRRSIEWAQLEQFLNSFPSTVKQIPNLPDQVIDAATAVEKAESLQAKFRPTATLIKALKETADHDDRSEPSLGILTIMADDLHVMFAVQILNTLKFQLATDVSDVIPGLEELLEHNVSKAALDNYQREKKQAARGANSVSTSAVLLGPAYHAWSMKFRVFANGARDHLYTRMNNETDPDTVTHELLSCIKSSRNEATQNALLQRLQRISPDCPLTKGYMITMRWDEVADKAEEWVNQTSSPNLINRMANHYRRSSLIDEKDFPLAEKYYLRSLDLDPSYYVYNNLATHYRNHGKSDLYVETLLKALTLPEMGLESARIHEQLAIFYMSENKFAEARSYALRTAASYSAWGLLCGARCLEGLGEWDKAEELYRANALRYEAPLEWYCFCQRTGKGDLDAARELFLQHPVFNDPEKRDTDWGVAAFHYFEGDIENSIRMFKTIAEKDPSNDVAIAYLSLILYEHGRIEEARDLWRNRDSSSQRTLIFDALLSRDASKIDWTPEELDFLEFFWPTQDGVGRAQMLIGSMLYHSRREEEAVTWLRQAESTESAYVFERTYAGFLLRNMGIAPTVAVPKTVDQQHPHARATYARFLAVTDRVDAPTRQQLIEQMVEKSPEWTGLRYWAASWLTPDGVLTAAEHHLDELLKKLPQLPQPRCDRARIYILQKRFTEARDEYEAILKTFPYNRSAINNLAWIYAAAPDDSLRNGARALELARQLPQETSSNKSHAVLLLAVAHAECGEFDEAIKLLEQGLEEKTLQVMADPKNRAGFDPTLFLELFRKKQPYHQLPQNSLPKFFLITG